MNINTFCPVHSVHVNDAAFSCLFYEFYEQFQIFKRPFDVAKFNFRYAKNCLTVKAMYCPNVLLKSNLNNSIYSMIKYKNQLPLLTVT